jgi:hypothetical protein
MPLVSKAFGDIITFTRASTATFFDSAGVLTSAAIDAPRLDYDPSTLAAQGLLIEESRTNSIRNNTMQGAVAGTPGTPPTNWTLSTTGATTIQVVGTGTENGITYIDYRFQGTGAADTWNIIYDSSAVAANGQSWTGSVYLKLAAGSNANLPFIQRVVFRDSGFANIQALDSSAIAPTTANLRTQRNTISSTATQAATAFVTYQLNSGTPTGAYDITLRIGLPQLELGAFATSVIPTTTTALTRAADVASVNTLSPWYNASAGTLYAEAVCVVPTSVSFVAQFNDLTTSNFIDGARYQTTLRALVNTGGVNQSTLIPGTAAGAVNKTALAYAANDIAMSANGAAALTDTSATIPTVTRLWLGDDGSGSPRYLNGYLRRITYYPRRLSNAELQAITT